MEKGILNFHRYLSYDHYDIYLKETLTSRLVKG